MTKSEAEVTALVVPGSWESVFEPANKRALEAALPNFLKPRRWFAGKARKIESAEIIEAVSIQPTSPLAYVVLIKVTYSEGDPDTYVLPMTFLSGNAAAEVAEKWPSAIVARLACRNDEGVLLEALLQESLSVALLEAIAHNRRFQGASGELAALSTRAFKKLRGPVQRSLHSSVMAVEQSNTSIVYEDKLILKVFRRLHQGVNPDVEIGTFLTERTSFRHFPPVAGTLAYRRGENPPMSMAILQAFVPNQGDAWRYTLDVLREYFERVAAARTGVEVKLKSSGQNRDKGSCVPGKSVGALIKQELPPPAHELLGAYLESARLLGERTAELHIALASDSRDLAFAPEPFTEIYQRSLYQSMHNLAGKTFQLLRNRLGDLPESAREPAGRVSELEQEVLSRFRSVLEHRIDAVRTRTHGDYHLGQVLHTANDFVIIDFEGEPGRSIGERRVKISPLRDVAGMVRSFHYAAYSSLISRSTGAAANLEDGALLEQWAHCWYAWTSSAFLQSYLRVAARAPFVPQAREQLEILLQAYLLEKAIYELGYELNNRPDWVRIPLQGILELLEPAR